jgi:hypothetical protein
MRQLLLIGLAFTLFVSAVSAGTTYGMIQAFRRRSEGRSRAPRAQGRHWPDRRYRLDGAAGPRRFQHCWLVIR